VSVKRKVRQVMANEGEDESDYDLNAESDQE